MRSQVTEFDKLSTKALYFTWLFIPCIGSDGGSLEDVSTSIQLLRRSGYLQLLLISLLVVLYVFNVQQMLVNARMGSVYNSMVNVSNDHLVTYSFSDSYDETSRRVDSGIGSLSGKPSQRRRPVGNTLELCSTDGATVAHCRYSYF